MYAKAVCSVGFNCILFSEVFASFDKEMDPTDVVIVADELLFPSFSSTDALE